MGREASELAFPRGSVETMPLRGNDALGTMPSPRFTPLSGSLYQNRLVTPIYGASATGSIRVVQVAPTMLP